MKTKRVDEPLVRYVQTRLKAELVEWGAITRLAEAIDFSDAHIANAKNHGRVGYNLAEALASHWGVTLDEMRAAALGKAPTPRLLPIAPDDRYASRADAVAAWRKLGRDESVVADVLAVKLDADSDPGAEFWFGELETALRRSRALGKGKAIGVRAATAVDDEEIG